MDFKPLTACGALIACTCFCCFAGRYYVDFQDGSDFHDGRSTATAWEHCPGDLEATGKAMMHTFHGNDTVIFKGGVHYKGSIALLRSGSTGRPIVYDGNTSGKWGSGRAVIDGEKSRFAGFLSQESGISEITIRGFEIVDLAANPQAKWESGKGIVLDAAEAVTVSNCFIHDIGYWRNDGAQEPSGYGIVLRRPRNCRITGCEITRTGQTGIWLDGAYDCEISANDIHDCITWGIDLSGGVRTSTRNRIVGNAVHDLYQFDRGYWKGSGDPPHTDFLFIRKGNGSHPVHNVVERNLFYNDCTFAEFGGTAMIFLSFADSTVIRQNVCINAHSYSAVFFGWTSHGTVFCNNTIYSPRTGALRLSTSGDNHIVNNLFVCNSSGVIYDSVIDEKDLVMRCNLYCLPDDQKSFARATPWTGWSFGAWRLRGYDSGSLLVPSEAKIRFVSSGSFPVNCRAMDLRVLPGSPAIGAAVKDKNGMQPAVGACRFEPLPQCSHGRHLE